MPTAKVLEEINKYNLKIQSLRSQLSGDIDSAENKYISKRITEAESKRAELVSFGISTREKNDLVKEAISSFTQPEAIKTLGGHKSQYVGYSKVFNAYVSVDISSYSHYLKGIRGYGGLAGKSVLNSLSFISEEKYMEIIEDNKKAIQEKSLKKLVEMKAKMSSHRTYVKGDEHKYYGSNTTYNCVPGLFVYSGFGSGSYHSIDGNIYSCSTSESADMAKLEQVEWKNIDSFAYHRTVYVGD